MPDFTTTLVIGNNHPSLPGHFPGHAVVPGVVLLAHIQAAMKQVAPEHSWKKIVKAKFEKPAPIDKPMQLDIKITQSTARFACHYEQRRIVSGRVTLQ